MNNTAEFIFQGKPRKLLKRGANWSLRLFSGGKDRWVSLRTGIQGSAIESAKALLKANEIQTAEELRASLGQAPKLSPEAAKAPLISDVIAAFEACPHSIGRGARYGYRWALKTLIEATLGVKAAWDSHPASILTEDLVYRFRKVVLERAKTAPDSEVETAMRSANSTLRQARALFSAHLLEYYKRDAGLALPDINGFRTATGFRGAAKTEYQQPPDDLIKHTLAELEASRDLHPARYLACWLALGFGLRKSEISALRADCFVEVNGVPNVELRAVTGFMGGESDLTKNGTRSPRVPVANGAWARIAPFLERASPEDYLIPGTMTYRTDHLFREINEWLRGLGWKTQKGFHEFRAYAGCRVIEHSGWTNGSRWLRHESVTTTEHFYGRYFNTQVADVALELAPVVAMPANHPRAGGGAIFA